MLTDQYVVPRAPARGARTDPQAGTSSSVSHPHRPRGRRVRSGSRALTQIQVRVLPTPRWFPSWESSDWPPLASQRRLSCFPARRLGARAARRTPTPFPPGGHISTELRINDRIRVAEVRLVGPNGETVGIVPTADALRLAQEADLDLVEIAPQGKPPVCKLMDYGKFKYENAQKAREARRNQTNVVIKEMKLRPKIDAHDYETKKGHVVRFLTAGDKVKITIMFRGREQHRPELGFRLLQRLAEIGRAHV